MLALLLAMTALALPLSGAALFGSFDGGGTGSAFLVIAAGATLALAYLGTAYHLRAGGAFGFDERNAASGWTTRRRSAGPALRPLAPPSTG